MLQRNLLWTYILLIVLHLFHVWEEVIWKASFIDTIYKGTNNFLIINIVIIIVPIILLFYTINGKNWAYFISYGYAGIMIIDGLSHILYFSAGAYTAIGLIIAGFLLIYTLKTNKKLRWKK